MLFNNYSRSGRPDTIRILISIEEAVMIPLNTNNSGLAEIRLDTPSWRNPAGKG